MRILIRLVTIIITLFVTCFSTFATNLNQNITSTNSNASAHKYIERANAIKNEIEEYTKRIKELNEYNARISSKLKQVEESYKKDKNTLSTDTMRKIKSLRKSLQNNSSKEKTVIEEDSIKYLVQNKEYATALEKLNSILEMKKEQLEVAKEKNAIWHQIDVLIG